jgi:hypothetical protein
MKFVHEVTTEDLADSLLDDWEATADLLMRIACNHGEGDAALLAEMLRDKIYTPDPKREALLRLGKALVLAAQLP